MTTSAYSYGLSAAGYTAPRQADYLELIRSAYEAELVRLGFQQMPDWERDTFLGQISEIMAWLLGNLAEGNQAVYDARHLGNATGIQLANLALLVGVTRQEATYSTVTLTCTGSNGTVITQGKIVQGGGSDGNQRWIITSDGTISGGSCTVTARAEDKGQIVATAGQITTIVTPVSGWSSVTNAAAANPGDDRESDASLRARRQQRLAAAGSTNAAAILSALLAIEGVSGAVVLDNPTGSTVTTSGISIGPYGAACVVAPDTMGDDVKEAVVNAIFTRVGIGTPTSGSESATVTKRDGLSHVVRYTLAASTAVDIAFTLTMAPGYLAADLSEDLEALVTDYFLTLGPASTVYPAPLLALAMTLTGVRNAAVTLDGGAAPVTMTAAELPTLGTFSVS